MHVSKLILMGFSLYLPVSVAAELEDLLKEARPIINEYCIACHGDKDSSDKVKIKGEINLHDFKNTEDYLKNIEVTKKMLEALEFKEMPTKKAKKKLPDEKRTVLLTFTKTLLTKYLKGAKDLPPIVLRRMNRYEYNNAVKDLLKMRCDLYTLPEKTVRDYSNYFKPANPQFPQGPFGVGNRTIGKGTMEQPFLTGVVPFSVDLQAEHGFNNYGDHLSISPILLESFLNLSQSIVNSPQFEKQCSIYNDFFKPAIDFIGKNNKTVKEKSSAPLPNTKEGIAYARIHNLLTQAFRKEVDELTLKRYQGFFSSEYKRTGDFTAAMKRVVSAVISSPNFIYMIEDKSAAETIQKIDDYELASRLSFFLWSSIPDEELIRLAANGELSKPDTLKEQVSRMLKNKRVKAMSESFCSQWLQLDRLISAQPDRQRFPHFYTRIGCEYWGFNILMMLEPILNFEAILVEDRPIMDLVHSDFTYRSKELHAWYKQAKNNIRFKPWGKMNYSRYKVDNMREGGVLFTAATYNMNATPLRTSPIKRGAWVATVVFNDPPSPPPDNVGEIENDPKNFKEAITLRQRLNEHKENENCAACHAKIDPLGFSMENFDAVGRYRDKYHNGLPIDATGELFGKDKFNDVGELKKIILKKPEVFTRAFTKHLLSYALGRQLIITDEPAVDKIVIEVMDNGGQFSTLIQAVVKSYPFLHKTNQQNFKGQK